MTAAAASTASAAAGAVKRVAVCIANECCRCLAAGKRRLAERVDQEVAIGARTENSGRGQSGYQPAPRFIACRAMHDDLRKHGVIERRYVPAGLDAGIDANVFAGVRKR